MKPIAPYELQEIIEDNIHKLVNVYEDEIYTLKCKLEEAGPQKESSSLIFRNQNGNDYLILDQFKDIALLAQINEKKFVVAYGLGCASWGQGSYYSELSGAYEEFREIKEGY